jgi:enoyl-CoA hydratase/carnithine racemase
MRHIRVDHHDRVAVITIDRRDRFNSLDVDTARDLRKATHRPPSSFCAAKAASSAVARI